jgi:hypothetical protein
MADGSEREPGGQTGNTLAALLKQVVRSRSDPAACQQLLHLFREKYGAQSDTRLAKALTQTLSRRPPPKQEKACESLALQLAPDASIPFVLALAGSKKPAGRQLALALLGRWPRSIDLPFLQPLRELLPDRRLAITHRLAALAALFRTLGPDNPQVPEFLHLLVEDRGKARSIERLRRLEMLVGADPAIDAVCKELEENLNMSCPRCEVQLRRPEMIKHLWTEHRLVLDRRRVREPWALVEEWIEGYRTLQDPELLGRCRTLAERLDGARGLYQLDRMLLTAKVESEEVLGRLQEEAARQHASICPWCYALAPQPVEDPPLDVFTLGEVVVARGYELELSEEGWVTQLRTRTPSGEELESEPGRPLTRWGAIGTFVGPLVLLALLLPVILHFAGLSALTPVLALLVSAGLAWGTIQFLWRGLEPAADRVRRYAWTHLVPQLHQDGFVLEDSAFLAGLARLSERDGESEEQVRELRAGLLPPLIKQLQEAVGAGTAPPAHLAAVQRLLVADAVAEEEDPIPLVVDQLALCFEGKLPLLYAERLLDGWESTWWTPGNLARLRVLLCDRAFEVGYEVRNLVDAGQTVPSLGTVLQTDQPHALAALRLLWSQRAGVPWERCGSAQTVFDLALSPESADMLKNVPDLLLYQEEPDWPQVSDTGKANLAPVEVRFCVRGVYLQRILFTSMPRSVEVTKQWRNCELNLDDKRFWSRQPLDTLEKRMERWSRWAFLDFLPGVPGVQNWQSPDRTTLFRAWGARDCPECHKYFLPRVGALGVAQREDATVAQVVGTQ